MTEDVREDLGYLTAKIEALCEDVRELKDEVRILQADFQKRTVIQKILMWLASIITTLGIWAITHLTGTSFK